MSLELGLINWKITRGAGHVVSKNRTLNTCPRHFFQIDKNRIHSKNNLFNQIKLQGIIPTNGTRAATCRQMEPQLIILDYYFSLFKRKREDLKFLPKIAAFLNQNMCLA